MDALRAAVPYAAYGFVSLVGLTARLSVEGEEHLEAARSGGAFIYAFWHQRQVFFTWTHRDVGATVLVSRSKDGELIARTMELSRIASARGSSSRGGVAATKELLDLLASGRSVGITPDGPKGPAREVKPGVLALARLSGAPILPLSCATSRRIVLEKSWDKFHVPLPFSRAAVVHAPLLKVGAGDSDETAARELKARLDAATARADALVA